MTKDKFDFEDLLEHVKQMSKLGSLEDLLPNTGIFKQAQLKNDEKNLPRMKAIIESMTPKERKHPEIINGSRRNRIAKGSGTSIQEINRLLKQIQMMQKLSNTFKRGKLGKIQGNLNFLWKNLK